MKNIFDNDLYLIAFWFGVMVASVIYRSLKGKPIFYSEPSNIKFKQVDASGRSYKNLFTRIVGAHHSLAVYATNNEVHIHPHFLGNLCFYPELSRLEYTIPIGNIVSAKIVDKFFGREVELEFRNDKYERELVSFWLRSPESFMSAIGKMEEPKGEDYANKDSGRTAKPIHPGA